MSKYLLYPGAKRELEDIWYYTKQRWGEQQADKYIHEIDAHIQKAEARQIPWRRLPKQALLSEIDVYQIHYKRHYIFFRKLKNGGLGVMSVLHDAMDIPGRLREILAKMDS